MNDRKSAGSPVIKNTPVILTVIFTFLTGGIYCPCWFLTRREQINRLHSDKKIGRGVFIFGIVIYSVSLLLTVVSGVLAGVGDACADTELLAMAKSIDLVCLLLLLIAGIVLLVPCFTVRRIFEKHFNEHLGKNIPFSRVATFFFQIYYLQYKINRLE